MQRFNLALTLKETLATYMAPAVARILAAFGVNFLNQFLPNTPVALYGRPLTTVFSAFALNLNHTVDYYAGTWSAEGAVAQNPTLPEIFKYVLS